MEIEHRTLTVTDDNNDSVQHPSPKENKAVSRKQTKFFRWISILLSFHSLRAVYCKQEIVEQVQPRTHHLN